MTFQEMRVQAIEFKPANAPRSMKIGILVRRGAMMQEPIADAEWADDAIERLGPTTPQALKILSGRHTGACGPRTVATVAISFSRSPTG